VLKLKREGFLATGSALAIRPRGARYPNPPG